MSKKKKSKKLDEFHYHEALDRTHVCLSIIDDNLLKHPVIQKHKKLKIRVELAQDILVEVYQRIGGLELKKFPDEQDLDSK